MSESVELLKAKLLDCGRECDKLHREKMDLLALTATLQNEIFALRAAPAASDEEKM